MNSAQIIATQLGGTGRLSMMIGAKNFAHDNDGRTLLFSFPNRQRSKPNCIKVTHNGKDLYDVEFGRRGTRKHKELGEFGVREDTYKIVGEYSDIFADMLMDIFEKETELYLTISPRR